jgi:hypothetical protein
VAAAAHLAGPSLVVYDDDGEVVPFDDDESSTLWSVAGGLEPATVSACPTCRSRIVAAVALVDLLGAAPPFARAVDLVELADDAPTLHLYVRDLRSACAHRGWLDPGFEEWAEVMDELADTPRMAR